MIRLKSVVTGINRYCVPVALAALSSGSSDQAAKTLREAMGSRSCRRVPKEVTLHVLTHWQGNPKVLAQPNVTVTVNQFILSHSEGTYLISASNHMILVHDGWVLDSGYVFSKELKPYNNYPVCKRRVKWACKITSQISHETPVPVMDKISQQLTPLAQKVETHVLPCWLEDLWYNQPSSFPENLQQAPPQFNDPQWVREAAMFVYSADMPGFAPLFLRYHSWLESHEKHIL